MRRGAHAGRPILLGWRGEGCKIHLFRAPAVRLPPWPVLLRESHPEYSGEGFADPRRETS